MEPFLCKTINVDERKWRNYGESERANCGKSKGDFGRNQQIRDGIRTGVLRLLPSFVRAIDRLRKFGGD